ncbi:MAG: hypothetical protein ACT4PV_00650 [Planctomycetaceae bacterium]
MAGIAAWGLWKGWEEARGELLLLLVAGAAPWALWWLVVLLWHYWRSPLVSAARAVSQEKRHRQLVGNAADKELGRLRAELQTAQERVAELEHGVRAKEQEHGKKLGRLLAEHHEQYRKWGDEKTALIEEKYALERRLDRLVGRLPRARQRLKARAGRLREWHRQRLHTEAEPILVELNDAVEDIRAILGDFDADGFHFKIKDCDLGLMPITEHHKDNSTTSRIYADVRRLGELADALATMADELTHERLRPEFTGFPQGPDTEATGPQGAP